MKSNEIRIGNYYDNNGRVEIVSPNTIEEVWIAERSWCKPIQLTEEWLLKLPKKFTYPKWIKHVHTLQNWYYYNNKCEKELTFK